jgi:hypothetical protein
MAAATKRKLPAIQGQLRPWLAALTPAVNMKPPKATTIRMELMKQTAAFTLDLLDPCRERWGTLPNA